MIYVHDDLVGWQCARLLPLCLTGTLWEHACVSQCLTCRSICRSHVQTFVDHGLPSEVPLETRSYIFVLFERFVGRGLTWLRSQPDVEHIPSVDTSLVTTLADLLKVRAVPGLPYIMLLARILRSGSAAGLLCVKEVGKRGRLRAGLNMAFSVMQSLLATAQFAADATLPSELSHDELKPLVTHFFVFSYAWALGGNLTHMLRGAYNAFLKDLFADLLVLPHGPLLDSYVSCSAGHPPKFCAWADAVPDFQQQPGSLQRQILVPTVDTVRTAFLTEARVPFQSFPCSVVSYYNSMQRPGCGCQAWLDVQRPVLLTGTTGVGKSVVAATVLENLRARKGALPFSISFSAQTAATDTQARSAPCSSLLACVTGAVNLCSCRHSWRASLKRSGGRALVRLLAAKYCSSLTTSTCLLRCATVVSNVLRSMSLLRGCCILAAAHTPRICSSS